MVAGPVNTFMAKVKKDDNILSLYRNLRQGTYSIDMAENTREIYHLHADRRFRRPNIRKEILASAQQEITNASVEASAYRSRVVEIKMRCFEIHDLLDELIESSTKYMLAKYDRELTASYRNATAGKDAIKYVLAPFVKRQRELNRVMKLADMVIEDLDKSSYHIRHVLDALLLSVSRSRNL